MGAWARGYQRKYVGTFPRRHHRALGGELPQVSGGPRPKRHLDRGAGWRGVFGEFRNHEADQDANEKGQTGVSACRWSRLARRNTSGVLQTAAAVAYGGAPGRGRGRPMLAGIAGASEQRLQAEPHDAGQPCFDGRHSGRGHSRPRQPGGHRRREAPAPAGPAPLAGQLFGLRQGGVAAAAGALGRCWQWTRCHALVSDLLFRGVFAVHDPTGRCGMESCHGLTARGRARLYIGER
mmetsp:Transcript_97918/g.255454  ORF Transcript_97918/g.255454 Transcript_97918/m.255454 type:complete len:236 (+) Transcript_97918:420-1127(+)